MEVLGVSHAIFGAECPETVVDFFAARGYRIAGRNPQLVNAPQRARHIAGPMSATADVTLLHPPGTVPAIEIMREPAPPEGTEAVSGFAWTADTLPGVRASAAGPDNGFAASDVPAGELRSFAVTVRCADRALALAFWQALGIPPVSLSDGGLRVDLRRSLIGSSLSLHYVVESGVTGRTWLNQRGLVCIGLFCRNLAALRERLAAAGFDAGEPFEVAPFGQTLRVFIVRSRSGELFEFVSVGARAA